MSCQHLLSTFLLLPCQELHNPPQHFDTLLDMIKGNAAVNQVWGETKEEQVPQEGQQRRNAAKDNTKGAITRIEDNKSNPVFASSDDEEDDNDAVSSKSSGGDFKEDDWKALTKLLPAAVQECWRQRGRGRMTWLNRWKQVTPRNQLLWKVDECQITQKMKTTSL